MGLFRNEEAAEGMKQAISLVSLSFAVEMAMEKDEDIRKSMENVKTKLIDYMTLMASD
jgi:hypothetical protein